MTANTITPIPNPIKRDGHISPLYAITRLRTENMNSSEIGTPRHAVNHRLFFKKSYFICPCN